MNVNDLFNVFNGSQTDDVNTDNDTIEVQVQESYGVGNGLILAYQELQMDDLIVREAMGHLNDIGMGLVYAIEQVNQLGHNVTDEQLGKIDGFIEVYEAENKNVWNRIIEGLKKIWARVTGFFKGIARMFENRFKEASKFAADHEKDISGLNLSGWTYKGFEYTNLDDVSKHTDSSAIDKLFDATIQEITSSGNLLKNGGEDAKKAVQKMRAMREQITERSSAEVERYRGSLVGGGSLSTEQYRAKLFSHFRNGATNRDSKKDISTSPSDMIAALKDTGAKKSTSEAIGKMDKSYGEQVRKVQAVGKQVQGIKIKRGETTGSGEVNSGNVQVDAAGKTYGADLVRSTISLTNELRSVQSQYFNAWKDAFVERESAYKSAINSAIHHKAS